MRFIAALALPLLVLAAPAGAVVINVTTTNDEINPFSYNGQCSLREAIQAANTDTSVDSCAAGSGADTILVPAGNYALTISGSGEEANQTGDLDVTEDVEIAGAGPGLTVIDQTSLARVMHVLCDSGSPAEVTVTIRDLRLTEGGDNDIGAGGLQIDDCAFPVHATLERLEVDNNLAIVVNIDPALARPGGGIGIDTAGLVTIRDSLIRDNGFAQQESVYGSLGGGGIGISGSGSTLIVDSLLEENFVQSISSGQNPSGGGVWTNSTTEIRGTTFRMNSALGNPGSGGGIYCESTLLKVENSTFFDNSAVGGGGAFGNGVDGTPGCISTFDSVTMTGNRAVNLGGGGILNLTGGMSITNSIIAGNENSGGGPDDVVGAFTSGDYNLIGAIDGSTGFSQPNDLTGTVASPLDPLLGTLGSEGFAVPTIAPLPGSPALDSGGATALTLDQRGLPRGSFGVATERGAAEVLNANYGVYLDVATHAGSPSSSYSAAATTPGVWNALDLTGPTPVVDRLGAANPVTASVTSESAFGVSAGATDATRLFLDDARDCTAPETWNVDFAGLPDGDYRVLVYAPSEDTRSTGDILVGSLPLASLPGDSNQLHAGASFDITPEFTLAGGALSISGDNPPGTDCAGIAGVQIVPEPGGWLGFWSGLLVIAGLGARRVHALHASFE